MIKNKLAFMIRFSWIIIFILSLSNSMQAQDNGGDFFSNIGKIYVVVTVVLISFLGILFYMIYLDQKIRKIEKKMEE